MINPTENITLFSVIGTYLNKNCDLNSSFFPKELQWFADQRLKFLYLQFREVFAMSTSKKIQCLGTTTVLLLNLMACKHRDSDSNLRGDSSEDSFETNSSEKLQNGLPQEKFVVLASQHSQEELWRVFSPWEKNCRDKSETCRIIDGIRVCDNKFILGSYQCYHFAIDFEKEAEKKGIRTWRLHFGCGYYRGLHYYAGYKMPFYHAINIVDAERVGENTKYCAIEPQSNVEKVCWVGDSKKPSVPSFAQETLKEKYSYDCVKDGWKEIYDVL